MRANGAAAVVCIVVVLAGCTSAAPAGTPATASSVPPQAVAPTVAADIGSIHGTVVDDEARSVIGAKVSLLPARNQTTTDSSGAFTFNDLQPGSYTLILQELGYESFAKKVEVAAGQVTKVSVVLRPIAVETEPYYIPMLRVGFIQFDQTWFSYVYHDLGGQNHSALCGTCIYTLQFPKAAWNLMTEVGWTQTSVPSYNDAIHIGARSPSGWDNYQFCWHGQHRWGPPHPSSYNWDGINKTGKIEMTLESSFYGVALQQKVDMWNTAAYLADLPENYTAFPPTTEKPQGTTTCDL